MSKARTKTPAPAPAPAPVPGGPAPAPQAPPRPAAAPPSPGSLAIAEPAPVESLTGGEWLLTNGLGGFAMGTVSGIPTRRYHGLLIGATMPPVGRILALSATVDTITFGPGGPAPRRVDLCSFRFRGPPLCPAVRHPDGAARLVAFEAGERVRWVYRVGGATLTRELTLADGLNACALHYRLDRGVSQDLPGPLRLSIRPLVALRDMHALMHRASRDRFRVQPAGDAVAVEIDGHRLSLRAPGVPFHAASDWWHEFFYQIEQDRGQDCFEDLFSPGEFVLDLGVGDTSVSCTITAALNAEPAFDIEQAVAARRARAQKALAAALPEAARATLPPADAQALTVLIRAADDFVVARQPPANAPDAPTLRSIIAGYPWFSDWGRDTCISMPGLMLVTGRFDEARRALAAFAGARKDGVIPNLFDDRTGHAEHNTVDASLWFVLAATQYAARSGDVAGFERDLLPACLDVVSWYRRGTLNNIAMDPMDKLLTAGSESTQLTWMDARRDGVVFTPRFGKPVEINALWCAALSALSEAMTAHEPRHAANLRDLAAAAAASFRQSFWNPQRGCLFDRLVPTESSWKPVAEVRPNQIFAVSLPGGPLTPEQQRGVLARVREDLLTPVGLRTLAPGEPGYQPRYEGSMFERDRAYHNGTAWPWLLGPYAEAVLRVGAFSPAARSEARAAIQPLIAMMSPEGAVASAGCIGQIAEIFDAEPPHRPQGCPAQAWSVAEVLRVLVLIHTPTSAR